MIVCEEPSPVTTEDSEKLACALADEGLRFSCGVRTVPDPHVPSYSALQSFVFPASTPVVTVFVRLVPFKGDLDTAGKEFQPERTAYGW